MKVPQAKTSLRRDDRPAAILLLDDEEFLREMLRVLLNEEFSDFQLVEFRNGDQALQHIMSNTVDLLLTDYAHPGADPHEIFGRLYKTKHTFPVIIASGYLPTRPDLQEPLLKFQQFPVTLVQKPFRAETLTDAVIASLNKPAPPPTHKPAPQGQDTGLPREWLRKRITISQADTQHSVHNKRLGPNPVPFGFCYDKWRTMLSTIEPGDELWEYSSSDESWKHLAGRAGIALVRNGRVIASILTVIN